MGLHEQWAEQLINANKALIKLAEIEELNRKFKLVNERLKEKAENALRKDDLDQVVTDEEQEEINELARQQEMISIDLKNKILEK